MINKKIFALLLLVLSLNMLSGISNPVRAKDPFSPEIVDATSQAKKCCVVLCPGSPSDRAPANTVDGIQCKTIFFGYPYDFNSSIIAIFPEIYVGCQGISGCCCFIFVNDKSQVPKEFWLFLNRLSHEWNLKNKSSFGRLSFALADIHYLDDVKQISKQIDEVENATKLDRNLCKQDRISIRLMLAYWRYQYLKDIKAAFKVWKEVLADKDADDSLRFAALYHMWSYYYYSKIDARKAKELLDSLDIKFNIIWEMQLKELKNETLLCEQNKED